LYAPCHNIGVTNVNSENHGKISFYLMHFPLRNNAQADYSTYKFHFQ
jgi:hypothetical protein